MPFDFVAGSGNGGAGRPTWPQDLISYTALEDVLALDKKHSSVPVFDLLTAFQTKKAERHQGAFTRAGIRFNRDKFKQSIEIIRKIETTVGTGTERYSAFLQAALNDELAGFGNENNLISFPYLVKNFCERVIEKDNDIPLSDIWPDDSVPNKRAVKEVFHSLKKIVEEPSREAGK